MLWNIYVVYILVLLTLVRFIVEIVVEKNILFQETVTKFNDYDFDLSSEKWKRNLWNIVKRTMIMLIKRLVYQLFLYAFDTSLLTDKVLDKLKKLSNQSLILNMTT